MRVSSIALFLVVLASSIGQPSAVGDASFTLPAVSYQWRSPKTQTHFARVGFHDKYPLTVEMMQKGIPRLSPQELHLFIPLITRLSQQQQLAELNNSAAQRNVTVVSLGGSFALGTQCCVGNSWPNRFVEWLREAYPLVPIQHVQYLKGSTNSLYGASVVRDLFDSGVKVDLLLLGYALNDEVIHCLSDDLRGTNCHDNPLQAAIYMSGNSTFISVTEQIVRRAVASDTAVLYLVETLVSPLAETTYQQACQLYNVPIVSYRKAIRQQVKNAQKLKENDPSVHFMKSKFSIFWPKHHTAPHPNW